MVDEVHELLYRGMFLFVVPLCMRGVGDVAACEGLSLLCGHPLGSRVPGCEARDCLSDIRGWCGEGPLIVD
jgi:hypothetical protein